MSEFEDFLKELQKKTIEFIEKHLAENREAAINDANKIVEQLKPDLENWSKTFAGEQELLERLVKAKLRETEIAALKEAELADISRDKFINGLIGVVVSTAVKHFLPFPV